MAAGSTDLAARLVSANGRELKLFAPQASRKLSLTSIQNDTKYVAAQPNDTFCVDVSVPAGIDFGTFGYMNITISHNGYAYNRISMSQVQYEAAHKPIEQRIHHYLPLSIATGRTQKRPISPVLHQFSGSFDRSHRSTRGADKRCTIEVSFHLGDDLTHGAALRPPNDGIIALFHFTYRRAEEIKALGYVRYRPQYTFYELGESALIDDPTKSALDRRRDTSASESQRLNQGGQLQSTSRKRDHHSSFAELYSNGVLPLSQALQSRKRRQTELSRSRNTPNQVDRRSIYDFGSSESEAEKGQQQGRFPEATNSTVRTDIGRRRQPIRLILPIKEENEEKNEYARSRTLSNSSKASFCRQQHLRQIQSTNEEDSDSENDLEHLSSPLFRPRSPSLELTSNQTRTRRTLPQQMQTTNEEENDSENDAEHLSSLLFRQPSASIELSSNCSRTITPGSSFKREVASPGRPDMQGSDHQRGISRSDAALRVGVLAQIRQMRSALPEMSEARRRGKDAVAENWRRRQEFSLLERALNQLGEAEERRSIGRGCKR